MYFRPLLVVASRLTHQEQKGAARDCYVVSTVIHPPPRRRRRRTITTAAVARDPSRHNDTQKKTFSTADTFVKTVREDHRRSELLPSVCYLLYVRCDRLVLSLVAALGMQNPEKLVWWFVDAAALDPIGRNMLLCALLLASRGLILRRSSVSYGKTPIVPVILS